MLGFLVCLDLDSNSVGLQRMKIKRSTHHKLFIGATILQSGQFYAVQEFKRPKRSIWLFEFSESESLRFVGWRYESFEGVHFAAVLRDAGPSSEYVELGKDHETYPQYFVQKCVGNAP